MAFINTIAPADSTGQVREMYAGQQRKYGYVPNYAKVFSHRPEVMRLWADLQYGIRRHMDKRRFELVTVAAAMALRSTYCSLAHGTALTRFFTEGEVLAIVTGKAEDLLSAEDLAIMQFARKVARRASESTAADVARLKAHGLSDAEVFDIAAAATARSFFAQLCEGLGAVGDHGYASMDDRLRDALSVGRTLEFTDQEKLCTEEVSEAADG